MNDKFSVFRRLALLALAFVNLQPSTLLAQGTAFSYQGQLYSGGSPANGSYDLRFTLYATNQDGSAVAGPVTNLATVVTNGLFCTTVDLGPGVFNGAEYWLDLAVRTNGASAFTELTPRQELTPTPYALFAASAGAVPGLLVQPNADGAPNVIAGSPGNFVANGFVGATIGGGGATNYNGSAYANSVTADFGTVSGGAQNSAGGAWATVGGGYGNTTGSLYATVGGGYYNNAGSLYSTVAGGNNNQATGTGSSVAGGGYDGLSSIGNTASGAASTVGGGLANFAKSNYATVGGGAANTAGGMWSTVAGGQLNAATNNFATVGGGGGNTAGGSYSTVAGGYGNSATGSYSFAAGCNNVASGNYSFVAGDNATDVYLGTTESNSFVWGDGSRQSVSQGANTFNVLATGGVWIFSGAYPAGVKLAAGSSSWATISDQDAKKNFQPVDTGAVLNKLAAIPIQEWNYKWEKDGDVPNIGPMAQDFKAAFYPGRDDKSITTLEFDGVELAAIQGLNQKLETQLKEKDARIGELEKRLNDLEQVVESLAGKK